MKGQLSLIEEKPITVLMSLREEYFNAMVKGTKRFEYRTRYLKDRSSAYIYISKTKKSIVAKIEFGEPIIGNAREIALLAEKEEPGCYDSILEYLYNDVGYAIPVESITSIEELTLAELKERFPNFVVPQSYYILDKKPELFDFLESKLEKKLCKIKK